MLEPLKYRGGKALGCAAWSSVAAFIWLGHACLISESLEQSWYHPLLSPCFSFEALRQVSKGRVSNPEWVDPRFESRNPRKCHFKLTKDLCISNPSAPRWRLPSPVLHPPRFIFPISRELGVHEVIYFEQWGSRTKPFSKEIKTVYSWFSFVFSSIW